MFEKFRLGILYKHDHVVNHRSLFKVLLNPILRHFGYCFGTILHDDGSLGGYKIMNCNRRSLFRHGWNLNDHNDFDRLEKRRWLI